MKKLIGSLCFIITLIISPPAYSELQFQQQSINIDNDPYNSFEIYDLDGDGDNDIYTLKREEIKWFENHNGEFILHVIKFNLDVNLLRLVKTIGPNIDFYSYEVAEDFSMKVYLYSESRGYEKELILILTPQDDSFIKILQGDFNGDGKVDFITTESSVLQNNEFYQSNWTYHYNLGNNQFDSVTAAETLTTYANENSINFYRVLDFNNDGIDDLLYYNQTTEISGSLVYHKNNASYSYELVPVIDQLPVSEVYQLRFLSRNEDGLLDVFNFGENTQWFEQSDNEFTERSFQIPEYSSSRFFFDDLDNDSDFDLISFPTYGDRGESYYYENTGSGFNDPIQLGYVNYQHSGFVNLSQPGESLSSFVALHWIYDSSYRINHYQVSNQLWEVNQVANDYIYTTGVEAVDLNRDQLIDLVSFDRWSTSIIVHHQTSPYQFTRNDVIKLERLPQTIKMVDYDSDDDLDLLTVNSDFNNSYFEIYLNDGFGNFSKQQSILLPRHIITQNAKTTFMDINQDGQQDIIYSDELGIELGWFRNDISSFEYQTLLNITPVNDSLLSFDFGDINGDGNLDVVFSYSYLCQFLCYGGTRYALYDELTEEFEITGFNGSNIYQNVIIENLNQDSNNEIILSKISNRELVRNVYIYENNEFFEITSPLDINEFLIKANDINDDEVIDFLYKDNSEYQFFTSNDEYSWSTEDTVGLDIPPYTLFEFEDIDGNGKMDIVSPNGRSLVLTFQGDLLSRGAPVAVNVNQLWAMLIMILCVLLCSYHSRFRPF